MAGATVLRGPLGCRKASILHTNKILLRSADLPLVIEMVDREAKIEAFLPRLDIMRDNGFVTTGKVKVCIMGKRSAESGLILDRLLNCSAVFTVRQGVVVYLLPKRPELFEAAAAREF